MSDFEKNHALANSEGNSQTLYEEMLATALHEAQERLNLSLKGARLGVWTYNVQTGEFWADARAKEMHGYAPDTPLDFAMAGQCVHPDDQAQASFADALAQRKRLQHELRIIKPDGSISWIASYAEFIPASETFYGISQDITTRKQTEHALREAQHFTQSILVAAPTLTYLFDLTTRRNVFISPQVHEMLGYTPEEIAALGDQLLSGLLHPDDAPIVAARLARILAANNDDIFELEYRMQRKDGSYLWLLSRDRIFRRRPDGTPAQMLGVATDITARKYQEEKLQTANYRFRVAEEAANGFNYDWDLQSGQVTRSESIKHVIGYQREELPASWQGWAVLVHPDDLLLRNEREAREFVQRSGEETFSGEYRIQHKNGHYVWVLERALVIRNEHGQAVRVIGQAVDITTRKQAEQSLRESETRLKMAMEIGNYGTWDLDYLSRTLLWSDKLFALFGLPPTSDRRFTIDAWGAQLHPDDLAQTLENSRISRATQQAFVAEYRVRRADDDATRWISALGQFFYDQTGQAVRSVGIAHDITERKNWADALRRSEERLRLVLESVSDFAIFTLTTEGRISSWNAGAERLFGYPESEILGQDLALLFTPEDCAQDVAAREIATALRAGRAEDNRWLLRRDGSRFFATGVVSLLKEGDEVRGLVKIAHDQTRQRQAEKALRDRELLQRMVAVQEDERRRIARDLHDELGQQMTALRLQLEGLRKLAAGNAQLVAQIDATQEFAQALDDKVGFLACELRPSVLDDLGLSATLGHYAERWSQQTGIKAEFHALNWRQERFATEIETNLYRIAQEALNNISKHARATNVSLLLEQRAGIVVLIIEDNGIGFDADENLARPQCLGLRGMAERAAVIGGSFEIESAPQQGATIFVRVALQQS